MSQARLGKNVGQNPLEHEHKKKAWQINILIQKNINSESKPGVIVDKAAAS